MGLLENISKKNPPMKAQNNPKELFDFSKTFQIITEIKTRLRIIPEILKWTKKLVCKRAKQ